MHEWTWTWSTHWAHTGFVAECSRRAGTACGGACKDSVIIAAPFCPPEPFFTKLTQKSENAAVVCPTRSQPSRHDSVAILGVRWWADLMPQSSSLVCTSLDLHKNSRPNQQTQLQQHNAFENALEYERSMKDLSNAQAKTTCVYAFIIKIIWVKELSRHFNGSTKQHSKCIFLE